MNNGAKIKFAQFLNYVRYRKGHIRFPCRNALKKYSFRAILLSVLLALFSAAPQEAMDAITSTFNLKFPDWLTIENLRWYGWQVLVGITLFVMLMWFFPVIDLPKVIFRNRLYGLDYAEGEIVGGIRWHQGYSRLALYISNPTNADFEEFVIGLESNQPFIDGAILPGPSGVSVTPDGMPVRPEMIFQGPDGRPHGLADSSYGVSVTISSHFVIRCPRLPKHQGIEVNLALVSAPMGIDRSLGAKAFLESPNLFSPIRTDPTHLGINFKYMSNGALYFGSLVSELIAPDYRFDNPKPQSAATN